jgi:NAD(P)-dependent dehydrogenase (short-subunit alcohol dehydrogenase family)
MSRIFITGSSDGLGSIVANRLVARGHSVVLHGRNAQRAKDALTWCPGAETVVTGDLSIVSETKDLADQVNKLGTFDCVIHNAGLYQGPFRETIDGIPALAAVNTQAPYILTSLITRPKRLVFLSSEMHQSGSRALDDVLWKLRGESAWDATAAYSASKLHNVMLAKAFAAHWPEIKSNALDPGWVATKMGGSDAPGSINAAVESYVMLAEGEEELAKKSGKYIRPGKREGKAHWATDDQGAWVFLVTMLGVLSKVDLPQGVFG